MMAEGSWDILWLSLCSLLLPIKVSDKRFTEPRMWVIRAEKKINQQSPNLSHFTDGESEVQKGEGIDLRSQGGIVESTSADF